MSAADDAEAELGKLIEHAHDLVEEFHGKLDADVTKVMVVLTMAIRFVHAAAKDPARGEIEEFLTDCLAMCYEQRRLGAPTVRPDGRVAVYVGDAPRKRKR